MKACHWLAVVMCTATLSVNADEALHTEAAPTIDG